MRRPPRCPPRPRATWCGSATGRRGRARSGTSDGVLDRAPRRDASATLGHDRGGRARASGRTRPRPRRRRSRSASDRRRARRARRGSSPRAHRGEIVAEVDGVRFVDNSKATNVHAALAALAAVDDAVLIAGGRAKGVGSHAARDGAPPGSARWWPSARRRPTPAGLRRARSRRRGGDHRGATVPEAFALARPTGTVLLAPGLRELGPVHRLRGARRPLRGRRPRAGRGERPWLRVSPPASRARSAASRTGDEPAVPHAAPKPARRSGRKPRPPRPPEGEAHQTRRRPRRPRLRVVPADGGRVEEGRGRRRAPEPAPAADPHRLLVVLGLVMVLSAGSISAVEGYDGNAFWYFQRQLIYALVGVVALAGRLAAARTPVAAARGADARC